MRTTVASGKRNGRKMGAGGAPATGLMRLRAPEPAAVGRAQAAAGAGCQPPPSCPTAAGKRDPTSGGRTLGTRRRWSCEPAWGRRGRPSSPEMISSVDHAKMLVYMVILDQKACRGARGGVNTVGASWGEVGVQRNGLQQGSSAPCSTLQLVAACPKRCCSRTHQNCTKTQRGAQLRRTRKWDRSGTSGSGQGARQNVQDMRQRRGLRAPQHLPWLARVGLSAGWRRQPLPEGQQQDIHVQIGENSFLLRKRKELC